jgi:hypothetical protein
MKSIGVLLSERSTNNPGVCWWCLRSSPLNPLRMNPRCYGDCNQRNLNLLTYEIKKPRPTSQTTPRTTKLSLDKNQKITPEIQARIHQYHFLKFWGDVGDIVYFHNGPNRGKKKDRIPWKVVEIEMDPTQVHWTNGGKIPNYIKLEGLLRGQKTTVWTCENKLVNSGNTEVKK